MEKERIMFCVFLILLLVGFFCVAKKSSAQKDLPYISAVQTYGKTADEDFIEIYNPACQSVDISGWKLRKRISSGTESSIKTLDSNTTIPAKGFFLWANSTTDFAEKIKADQSTKTSLSDNYSLAFFDNSNTQIDSITWGINTHNFSPTITTDNPAHGYAILRDENDNTILQNNYSPKNLTQINSDEAKNCPVPKTIIYSDIIRINEILPKPDSKNLEFSREFVELYNPSDETIDLAGWTLKDRSGKTCKLSSLSIAPKKFLVLYNNQSENCSIALNDTQGETLNLFNPEDFDPVSQVTYTGSAKENLSYSFDGSSWRWSKFITPDKPNILNNLPKSKNKIPKNIYAGVNAHFTAHGSDADDDELKYVWDFGDGHKSYLAQTKHKYAKTGKYMITLKIKDGSEEKIKTFNIKVEKFPHPKIKIVAIFPNPKGADTGKEYITIQNKSRKKINLKGWSIKTGTTKLFNHPITQDFFIGPQESQNITADFSKFTLPNTQGKIELLYPNGKIASHATYGNNKKSIAENAIYEKIQNNWEWNMLVPKIANTKPTPPTPPIPPMETSTPPETPITLR